MFFLLKPSGNVSLAALVMMIVMMPMFLLAMYEKNGQPLEVVARQYILAQFVRPKVRPYRTDNYYDALMRQYRLEQEVNAIVQKKPLHGAVREEKNRPSGADAPQPEQQTAQGDQIGGGPGPAGG